MAYVKLNKVSDIPESKTQLTKDWMSEYVIAKGTAEQIATCIKFLEDKSIDGHNNLTGEDIKKIDLVGMREWFCEEFFPNVGKKKKSSKKKEAQLSQIERLKQELEKKAGE